MLKWLLLAGILIGLPKPVIDFDFLAPHIIIAYAQNPTHSFYVSEFTTCDGVTTALIVQNKTWKNFLYVYNGE